MWKAASDAEKKVRSYSDNRLRCRLPAKPVSSLCEAGWLTVCGCCCSRSRTWPRRTRRGLPGRLRSEPSHSDCLLSAGLAHAALQSRTAFVSLAGHVGPYVEQRGLTNRARPAGTRQRRQARQRRRSQRRRQQRQSKKTRRTSDAALLLCFGPVWARPEPHCTCKGSLAASVPRSVHAAAAFFSSCLPASWAGCLLSTYAPAQQRCALDKRLGLADVLDGTQMCDLNCHLHLAQGLACASVNTCSWLGHLSPQARPLDRTSTVREAAAAQSTSQAAVSCFCCLASALLLSGRQDQSQSNTSSQHPSSWLCADGAATPAVIRESLNSSWTTMTGWKRMWGPLWTSWSSTSTTRRACLTRWRATGSQQPASDAAAACSSSASCTAPACRACRATQA